MTKLCVCDVDGVICNSTKRFEQCTVDGKVNWDRALSSELLHLDTLIPNAVEHLDLIAKRYDHIILLTSRYDHMRDGTVEWLQSHGILVPAYRLFMKPWGTQRYTKTKIWKAQQVIQFLREYNELGLFNAGQDPVTDLLIVEDEEQNLEAIREEVARWIMSNRGMRVHYFVSLRDAVTYIERGMLPPVVDDIPF